MCVGRTSSIPGTAGADAVLHLPEALHYDFPAKQCNTEASGDVAFGVLWCHVQVSATERASRPAALEDLMPRGALNYLPVVLSVAGVKMYV